jgi:hypothetical protein
MIITLPVDGEDLARPFSAFGGFVPTPVQSGPYSESGIGGMIEYTNPQAIDLQRPVAA